MLNSQLQIAFAKLEALLKRVQPIIQGRGRYVHAGRAREYYEQFAILRDKIMQALPEVYGDFPVHEKPESSGTSDFDGVGYVTIGQFDTIYQDIKQMLEIRSQLFTSQQQVLGPRRIFISHGRSEDWRQVQAYIERDLNFETLELAQEANRGRTVLQKLDEESSKCSFAVVVMTGDDRGDDGTPRARENVMHEIGFFQGKFGLANVCLLYEEGTNIPSNIHGLVYIPYPKGLVRATFGDLARELRSAFPADAAGDA